MVFEVRDLWPELPIAMGALRNPLLRTAASALEWVAYHGAKHVVGLSPAIAEGVVRRGIPEARVSVVSNACDLEAFRHADRDAAAARARHLGMLPPNAKVVLYGGTFGAINDVAWLADVAAASRQRGDDLQFVLVGDGAGRDALVQRATSHGVLDDNLHVLAPIPKREIPGLLGAATIATSLFMPLPEMEANSANKFFDALAAGKPVAINYGGWHAELLQHWGAGISLPHAWPATAAAQLAELARDPAALAEHGAAALRLARACFDRDALAADLLRVLCDAADTRGRASRQRPRSAASKMVRAFASGGAAVARGVAAKVA
jgi:glycosyltransferase involved in cell wall biosynthesis